MGEGIAKRVDKGGWGGENAAMLDGSGGRTTGPNGEQGANPEWLFRERSCEMAAFQPPKEGGQCPVSLACNRSADVLGGSTFSSVMAALPGKDMACPAPQAPLVVQTAETMDETETQIPGGFSGMECREQSEFFSNKIVSLSVSAQNMAKMTVSGIGGEE